MLYDRMTKTSKRSTRSFQKARGERRKWWPSAKTPYLSPKWDKRFTALFSRWRLQWHLEHTVQAQDIAVINLLTEAKGKMDKITCATWNKVSLDVSTSPCCRGLIPEACTNFHRNANPAPFRASLAPKIQSGRRQGCRESISERTVHIPPWTASLSDPSETCTFLASILTKKDKPLDVLNVGRVENLSQEITDGNSSLKQFYTLWILGNDHNRDGSWMNQKTIKLTSLYRSWHPGASKF